MIHKTTLAALALGAAFACFACEREETVTEPATPEPTTAAPPPAVPAEPEATRPTEPQEMEQPQPMQQQPAASHEDARILGALDAIHAHEIAVASFVVERAQDQRVREMAKMIIDDHQAALRQSGEIAKKLKLRPIDDQESIETKTLVVAKQLNELAPLTGAELDRAFTKMMAEGHRNVVQKVDQDMLGKAKASEINAMLLELRPKLVHHRDMAEMILNQPATM